MRTNLSDVDSFLKFLNDSPQEIFTCTMLDAASKYALEGLGVFHETRDEILALLRDWDVTREGRGTLHVTLNRTNLKGRRREHMESARVLCVDLDRWCETSEIKQIISQWNVQMVVWSSAQGELGKYHLYWRIDTTIGLQAWEKLQLGLAAVFHGDVALRHVSAGIRVPGVEREMKDGRLFLPEIVHLAENTPALDLDGVHTLFPEMNEWIALGEQALEGEREIRRELVKTKKLGAKTLAKIESRNTALYDFVHEAVYKSEHALAVNEGLAIGREFNAQLATHTKGSLSDEECERAARSAWRNGTEARERRLAQEQAKAAASAALLVQVQAAAGENDFTYDYSWEWLAVNRFTAQAVAERVLQRFGERLLRVGDLLYAFNSELCLWQAQRGSMPLLNAFVQQCCLDTMRDPLFISEMATDPNGGYSRDKHKAVQERFGSAWFTKGIVDGVRSSNKITLKSSNDFDAQNFRLFTLNGVIDCDEMNGNGVHTGSVRNAQAGDYLMSKCGASWTPGVGCDEWLAFLREVFAQNTNPQEMIDTLQQVFGYSLSGAISEQSVFVHWGGACNGKSLVLYALRLLAGSYGDIVSASSLAKTERAILKEMERIGAKVEGRRIIVIDDLETATQWNEGMVKTFTGDTITSRRLYEEERSIVNRAKFHIGCNEVPRPQSENRGILRRLFILPYLRTFEQNAEKEDQLRAMIKNNLNGILEWSVRGLETWLNNGRKIPRNDDVIEMTKIYAENHFTVTAILRDLLDSVTGTDILEHGSEYSWHSSRELLSMVEGEMRERGIVGSPMTLSELGQKLKSEFGAPNRRGRDANGRNTTFYQVKIKQFIKTVSVN